MKLPPVRLFKYATPVKAKTSAPPFSSHHLRGLDMAWLWKSNPHRESGTRSWAAADVGQTEAPEGLLRGRRDQDVRGPLGRLRWSMVFLPYEWFDENGWQVFSLTDGLVLILASLESRALVDSFYCNS
jgi:hypothetical protein